MVKKPSTEKVAFITGAARRIGAEIARTLHQAGLNVVLHYQTSESEANALCEALNRVRAHSAVTLPGDLSKSDHAASCIERAVSAWGRLDVLVNNASRFYRTDVGQVTEAAWDDLLNTNLKTPFFLAQSAASYLCSTKGVIINITDIHAERPMKDYSVYCISKAGLVMMTKTLARELAPVRVNGVAPGAIMWPEGENMLSEKDKASILKKTCLHHEGGTHDIASAVRYLVLDAPYVTGHIINVDGGRSMFT